MMEQRITARKNPLLQQVRRLLTSKKEREQAGLFVADGTKLLEEAVRYYPGLTTVILSDTVEAQLPEHACVLTLRTSLTLHGDVLEESSIPVYVGERGPLEAAFRSSFT